MARVNQSAARDRARAAKRRLDADRHERDKLIEEAATSYYAGQDLIDEGTDQTRQAIAVLLDDLGEPVSHVAVLLDLDEATVKRMRRQAKEDRATPAAPDTAPDTARDSTGRETDADANTRL